MSRTDRLLEMYTNLKSLSSDCRDELVALLALLVRTRSFSFKEEAAAGAVQGLLEELHYDLVFRDEVGNVIGVLAGNEEGPAVLLHSHLDIRRPESSDRGTADAQAPSVERGRPTVHGAVVSQGGLAAQIFAARVLDKSLLPLWGTIVVAATVAQEEGNGAGTRHLMGETLPKLGIAPGLAILGEPTGLVPYGAQDGRVHVDVKISGKDPSAVRRAAAAVRDALTSPGERGGQMDGSVSARLVGVSEEEREGSCEGWLQFRCRVESGTEAEDCVGRVKRLAWGAVVPLGSVAVDARVHSERRRFYTGRPVEYLCWSNPWSTDPERPLVRRALDALAAAGWPDMTHLEKGSDDLRPGSAGSLIADSYGVPTLCFGPGREEEDRISHEPLDVAEAVDAVFGTAVLVHGAIGTPVPAAEPADGGSGDGRGGPKVRSGA